MCACVECSDLLHDFLNTPQGVATAPSLLTLLQDLGPLQLGCMLTGAQHLCRAEGWGGRGGRITEVIIYIKSHDIIMKE